MVHESVETITSPEAFAALAASWAGLDSRRCGPLASHEWFDCAARAFCSTTLNVLVVRRAGATVAVAPLCRTKRRGIEWLETVGSSVLFEPTQLLAADTQALDALCRAIVNQGRPVALHRFDSADESLAALGAVAREAGTFRKLSESHTNFLPMTTQWSQVQSGMSPHRRKKMRYARKSLESHGGLTTEILTPRGADLPALLDIIFQVESSGWKGRNRSALVHNTRLRTFFEDFTARMAQRQALRVCLLRSAGRALAAQICVEHSERFWVLKIGFDETWARYSPGLLLTADTIEYALEQKHIGFEFLGSAEDWQQPWNPTLRTHHSMAFYPAGPAGRAALAVDTLATTASRALRWIRGRA